MPGTAAAATGQATGSTPEGPAPLRGAGDNTVSTNGHAAADEATFAERIAQGRLTTQRGLFAGPAPIVSKDLYSELQWGSVLRRRASVSLEPGTRISGNTYFGRFPASYWQRWTTVQDVMVEAVVSGDGVLSVGGSGGGG